MDFCPLQCVNWHDRLNLDKCSDLWEGLRAGVVCSASSESWVTFTQDARVPADDFIYLRLFWLALWRGNVLAVLRKQILTPVRLICFSPWRLWEFHLNDFQLLFGHNELHFHIFMIHSVSFPLRCRCWHPESPALFQPGTIITEMTSRSPVVIN